ncbi:AMP nucleosidase [Candidatus Paracaedibacter symbiosus]|uniref:AMP nucleosidase n=1 Tax=Candidatus Paracaedibacter symbiosus TaxID=244582 RepID=UPI00068D8CF3|nr:AMP nucleosidase [Candidatus Paracaedibacter symbiosus]
MLFKELLGARTFFPGCTDLKEFTDATTAVGYLTELYNKSTGIVRKNFETLLYGENEIETPENANYPFIGIKVDRKDLNMDSRHAYGVVSEPGVYSSTVTRPDIFGKYYEEQISLLLERHKVPIHVGTSPSPIPLPFALDSQSTYKDPNAFEISQLWQMDSGFVLPNLSRIDDDVANCVAAPHLGSTRPMSIFSGERTDFSLHRLHHYTGTSAEHFQGFVLLTNYQRYIDEFITLGLAEISKSDEYESLIIPGNKKCTSLVDVPTGAGLPQMPAYHLKRKDGMGITFVNIGVGPSNAKTITDHLAVLRPHCWLMLGHCAGLRSTQILGDYVLAHGYVREDHVLDQDLPPWIPVPPIAEVQVALQQAVANISHQNSLELKTGMRTGTVVTTDNRNWELRSRELYERFKQSRAIAVDMESATVAANGFRFRVPYGTLLCVSDKPIHGELKLRGMANKFYRERVSQHLLIGLEALRLIREQGVDQLHSRKLRGFDEPPFR